MCALTAPATCDSIGVRLQAQGDREKNHDAKRQGRKQYGICASEKGHFERGIYILGIQSRLLFGVTASECTLAAKIYLRIMLMDGGQVETG